MIGRDYCCRVLNQKVFVRCTILAGASALLAVLIKITDHNLKWDYLREIMPNDEVYTGISSIVSLLLVFRAVQCLNMYREGARNAYIMAGAWYDAASTLISFSRAATSEVVKVQHFKHTLVRLFSMLNMVCLSELENSSEDHRIQNVNLRVLDAEGLDTERLQLIMNSRCKPELVCQMIQCLVVDNLETGVLRVPAPILAQSFRDLGSGMLKFHETKNIALVQLPLPLLVLTDGLLFLHGMFAPFMMSAWSQGAVGAAWTTFIAVFVFNILNGVSREVENPFNSVYDADMRMIHHDLNACLGELVNLELPLSHESLPPLPPKKLSWHITSSNIARASEVSIPTVLRKQSLQARRTTKREAMDALFQAMLEGSERRSKRWSEISSSRESEAQSRVESCESSQRTFHSQKLSQKEHRSLHSHKLSRKESGKYVPADDSGLAAFFDSEIPEESACASLPIVEADGAVTPRNSSRDEYRTQAAAGNHQEVPSCDLVIHNQLGDAYPSLHRFLYL